MGKIIRLTESELTKLIGRVINEIREENPYVNFQNYLEDKIDFEGYEFSDNKNKLSKLYEIFKDERGYEIKREGEKNAMIDWLQGLPTSIHIPYASDEISNLLYALGFDEVKDMESDDVSELYYSIIAEIIIANKG